MILNYKNCDIGHIISIFAKILTDTNG